MKAVCLGATLLALFMVAFEAMADPEKESAGLKTIPNTMKAVTIDTISAAGRQARSSVRPKPEETIFPDLARGHWLELPRTRLSQVFVKPPPPGSTGQVSVISTWSGGVLDSKRKRLVIWGGGHSDYSGNEIYAFDLPTRRWLRLTEPSRDVLCNGALPGDPDCHLQEKGGYYADGLPRSRHTYDRIEYLPELDAMCAFGAAAMYPWAQTDGPNVDCYDFTKKRWVRKADRVDGFAGFVAYDPVDGRLWTHTGQNVGFLSSYDPVANVWHAHGTRKSSPPYLKSNLTAEIDAAGRYLYAIGGGEMYRWKLDEALADIRYERVTPNGETAFIAAPAPGVAYNQHLRALIGWSGGANVFKFDAATLRWEKILLAPTNTVIPSAANATGTYGRFRYVPEEDVFVVVNGADENVFVLRLP